MCNDAGLYDGGNADGNDRNAHGFLIDCSPLVAHAYSGCYAGVADLDGGADTACTAGGQCVDGKNKTGFYPFCDAAHDICRFDTGHAQHAGSYGDNGTHAFQDFFGDVAVEVTGSHQLVD